MREIKRRRIQIVTICVLVLMQMGCGRIVREQPEKEERELPRFERDKAVIDYSEIKFTGWDTAALKETTGREEKRELTIMIYMNGSDLESENGAATKDLREMMGSGVETERVNVVVFTGGTNRWQNNTMPAGKCSIWKIGNGSVMELGEVGILNMGDAGTLTGFIDYAEECYPAERYGLILWDHGGGSIAGYGHDEVFNGSCLTLLEMDYALNNTSMKDKGKRLEFIGFDACLMAASEMAVVASEYAEYLIASEDLEPGDGWDYGFLGAMKSGMTGEEIGKLVTDYYVKYYGRGTTESITMSVTDLTYAGAVMGAMGVLMERCSESLSEDVGGSFTALAKRRNRTKTFGEGTRRDNDCDMVDLGDMAEKLSDIYPKEARQLREAIGSAVVYNRHNSLTELGGLTAYYIYGGGKGAKESLATYARLGMSEEYTEYLEKFAEKIEGEKGRGSDQIIASRTVLWERDGIGGLRMVGKNMEGKKVGKWPSIGGRFVCLDSIGRTGNGEYYAIPVKINGEDADIVVVISAAHPEGQIMGTRREDGFIIQKGYTDIEEGDEIKIYYRTAAEGAKRQESWDLSEAVTAEKGMKLIWREPDKEDDYLTGTVKIDAIHNEKYENFRDYRNS